jgi:hypothetical protein
MALPPAEHFSLSRCFAQRAFDRALGYPQSLCRFLALERAFTLRNVPRFETGAVARMERPNRAA